MSQYAYFSNDELYGGERVYNYGDQFIDGPVFTNGQFNFTQTIGMPEFRGHVSSHSFLPWIGPGGAIAGDFLGGVTWGAPEIIAPSVDGVDGALTPIRTAARNMGGLVLTGDHTIEFVADGSMRITPRGESTYSRFLPVNGAILVTGGDLTVYGTLKGKVTIGVNDNIVIKNDIRYAGERNTPIRTPQNPYDSMLSLVAGRNIKVDDLAPFDLFIDAYLAAPNGSFLYEDWNNDDENRRCLWLYGGVMQAHRGRLGQYIPGEETGYSLHYTYDKRLEQTSPSYSVPLRDPRGGIIYARKIWRSVGD